jgi:hypothetical protein
VKARISIALLTALSVLAGLGIAYSQQKETPATNVSSRPAAQVTDPAKSPAMDDCIAPPYPYNPASI